MIVRLSCIARRTVAATYRMRPFVALILLTLATLAIHAPAQDVRVHVQRRAYIQAGQLPPLS